MPCFEKMEFALGQIETISEMLWFLFIFLLKIMIIVWKKG
jgi:hypothetical protein